MTLFPDRRPLLRHVRAAALACATAMLGACFAPHALAQDGGDPYALFDGGLDVAKLSDADADCETLYAEARLLEERLAAAPAAPDPTAVAMKMQEEILAAQQGARRKQQARSIGSQLLGLVPGVGGMAANAMLSAGLGRSGDLQDTIDRGMREQQAAMGAAMGRARLQGRREHVTSLFLDRGCRPSALDAAAVSRARSALAESAGAQEAGTPAE